MLKLKWTQASLQEIPTLGIKGRYPDMQEWVVSGIPYTLWYQVNPVRNTLEILRVLHNARQTPSSN